MSISPQQALDAVKVLRPNVDRITSDNARGVRFFDGLWIEWNTTSIEWPEGVTRWPPPEQKWVIPTDEDARQRPSCRVRDAETQDWFVVAPESALIGVSGGPNKFLVMSGSNSVITRWSFCEIKAEVQS